MSFTSPAPVAPSEVAGHHQRETERETRERRADRHAADPGGGEPDAEGRHRGGQRVRDPARAEVDDGRDERTGDQGHERRARN